MPVLYFPNNFGRFLKFFTIKINDNTIENKLCKTAVIQEVFLLKVSDEAIKIERIFVKNESIFPYIKTQTALNKIPEDASIHGTFDVRFLLRQIINNININENISTLIPACWL